MGLFQQASRKRITISLDANVPDEKTILDFLLGLPRRTRSDIIKEVLLEALEKRDDSGKIAAPLSNQTSEVEGSDPEEIIEKLF